MNNKNTNQSFFTNDERKEFMAFHEEGNSILAREHLGREDGKLFYDEVEDSPTYSGLSLEKATEIGNIIMALSNYNSPWDTIKLGDCSSVEEVIESAKEVYFDKVDEKYTIRKLQTLFNMLNGEEKKVLIYGVFGDLASRVFNVADAYKRCIKIYVSDKSLNNKKSYNGYSVVNFNEIESLSPDIILISAKFSGKDIKSYLSKLNLPTSAICPVYDFSDKIWENIIPSFFTRVSPNVL